MSRIWMRISIALMAAVLIAPGLAAQTTGRVTGTVSDDSGDPLPGVTVTATSPQLQGDQVAITDARGAFRLLNLRPGVYAVGAALDGFNTVSQEGINVGVGRAVDLVIEMKPAFGAEIVVTGEAPVVDTSSSATGINAGADIFENIPVDRNVYAIAQVAPGTSEDGAGTQFYGSTGAENQYVIEGLNTTGVELGTEGVDQLNFEFIQDVEVLTGGLPAQYGRMTGGVINVITKSGGNEVEGEVFGFFEGGGLRSDDKTRNELPGTATQIVNVDSNNDYGFSLGGYFVKDKLWYFAAYDRIDRTNETEVIGTLDAPGSPAVGSVIPSDTQSDVYAGKLTFTAAQNQVFTLSAFGDPSTRDGNIFGISGPEITWRGDREFGSNDFVLRYDSVLGNSWAIQAIVGRHFEEDKTTGPGKSTPQLIDLTVTPSTLDNGFGFHSDDEFERTIFRADASKFLGTHEIKFGGDLEQIEASTARFNGGGGQRIYRFASGDTIYYRHRFYVDDTVAGFDRNDPSTWEISVPLVSEPETDNTSYYVQDSWRPASNVTLNLGFRYERQEIKDRFGATSIDLDDNYAPRVGFVWDVQKNGRSKLYANYGRFFESVPMDINIRAFGGEVQCFCYNFSADPADIAPDATAPRRSSLLGGQEPVDPALKGQYIDEILVGYEYEVMPNFALGVKATYRDLGRVIEDFLQPDGNYFIANPGEGIGTRVTFYDYYFGITPFDAPAPKAEREYTSVELTARKRYSNNWQLIASYVWAELEGNYDGTFQISTGQLDPNINSAFDYADFMVNANGRLSSDAEHQLKLYGSYRVGEGIFKDLNIGMSAYWRSGLPLNAYGYSFAYSNWEFYLAPRGSLGEGPSNYEADLHLDYPIRFGNGKEVLLVADVFNVLDRQAITRVDERFNLSQDDFCAGIPADVCSTMGGINHVLGTTDAIGSIDVADATNPDFHKAGQAFTGERSIRLGVRFRF